MTAFKAFVSSQYQDSIQYRALNLMLLCGIVMNSLAVLIRIGMKAPMPIIGLSLTSAVVSAILLYYALKGKMNYLIKIAFLVYFDFIYFPLTWLTTPGSLNIMPYYSMLFLLATFILIEHLYEYLITALYMSFAIFLIYAEVRWPEFIHFYNTREIGFLGASLHYSIVTLLIGIIFFVIFQNYMDIRKTLSRKYVHDEMTGLYSRTHGMHLLRQAFETSTAPHTLVLMHLAGISQYNQVYGTQAGDKLIISLAKEITRNTRANDISCRYKGNLFMVVLHQSDYEQSDIFVHRLTNAFNNHLDKRSDIPIKLLVGKGSFDYNNISDIIASAQKQLEDEKKTYSED